MARELDTQNMCEQFADGRFFDHKSNALASILSLYKMSVKPLSTYAPHSNWTSPAISDRDSTVSAAENRNRIRSTAKNKNQTQTVSTRKLLHIPHATLMVISVLQQLSLGNWKSLPSELRQCDSIEQFKSRLKTHFFRLWDHRAL